MKFSTKNTLSIAVAMASSLTAPWVLSAGMLEEVVVTAQKREQNLQDTPISISAFEGQALEDQGIVDIGDVSQYAPNVQIAQSPGGSTGATIAMRGSVTVNPVVTIDTNVGVYLDGVFIAKNVGGLFDVAELERVEVLRGPQGTLYGKNTVGGAVNLISRKPTGEFGGKVRVGAGNFGYTDFYVSVDSDKINDMVSINGAVSKRDRDGFYDNLSPVAKVDEFKQLDSLAARFAIEIDVSSAMNIYYSYDMNERDNTPSFAQPTGRPNERLDNGVSDGIDVDSSESFGHSLHVSYDLSDSLTFKSITAYRELEFDDINDYDGGDSIAFLLHAERHAEQEQLSQEFQLIGQVDNLNYVVGLFYFDEEASVENPLSQQFFTPGAPFFGQGPLLVRPNAYGADSESYAIYGQADWALTDKLTLTAGARWTDEEKEGFIDHPADELVGSVSFATTTSDSWTNFSPMAVLSYQLDDDINTYFKISQGWKSGGFNAEAPDINAAQESYDEEMVTAIELGVKSRLMDNRLQVNAALFQNDIEDLQLSEVDPNTFYSQIFNAGESTVTGVELEVVYLATDSLTLNLSYGYLDAEYDEFISFGVDIKDEAEFPYTPEDTASAGMEYTQDIGVGQFSARVDYSYVGSHVVYHNSGQAELTKISGYRLLNARLAISEIELGSDGGKLRVGLWGKNLTDSEYRINGIPTSGFTSINYYGDPRTFGADITYEF